MVDDIMLFVTSMAIFTGFPCCKQNFKFTETISLQTALIGESRNLMHNPTIQSPPSCREREIACLNFSIIF